MSSSRSNVRWLTLGLIVALIVINYIDRSAISYAVDPLTKAFGISKSQYGLISSAFSIGYMVFAFLAGPLVDRYGARRILLVGVAIWSVVTAVTPVSGSFIGLFMARVILGAGEGPGFPAATRTVSRWLPQKERGIALAMVGGVAVAGSLLIGGPLVTQLIDGLGWRGMFWVLAALGALWFAIAWALLKNTPDEHHKVSAAERAHIAAGQLEEERSSSGSVHWRPVLTNRNLWVIAVGYFAWGFMFWGFMYWLPEYLSSQYDLSISAVGLFTVAPWAAGVAGALLGGVLTDQVFARTGNPRTRLTIMGVALLLSGAALIPIIVAPSLTVSVTFISIGVGLGFVTGGIWWVAAIDAMPAQPGVAAGFADAAFALSGIVAPSVMGFIVSSTGSFSSGFVVMTALAVVGAGSMLVLPRHRPRPEVSAPGGKAGLAVGQR
ncbi:putative sulfoacetate transporter SauU [Streptomyces sp. MBT84]|uniref:MFS transporter n=1 Tax=Streptomyces sp. MBT84 TaxID=1488414 RepID=UPI001C6EF810|nr:MFS transporter [Streptomyces sp. MBT84]MBW8706779.1 putative sulfoacetate transporter SauU [Streptomyces sp. MBT84]